MSYEKAKAEIISFDGMVSSTINSTTVYDSLDGFIFYHCSGGNGCQGGYQNHGNTKFYCPNFTGAGITVNALVNGSPQIGSFIADPDESNWFSWVLQ